jgi:hypothetical protein
MQAMRESKTTSPYPMVPDSSSLAEVIQYESNLHMMMLSQLPAKMILDSPAFSYSAFGGLLGRLMRIYNSMA